MTPSSQPESPGSQAHRIASPKFLFLLTLGLIAGAGSILLLTKAGITLEDLKTLASRSIEWMGQYPLLAYAILVLSAGIPVPLSPVILVAAVLFTSRYGILASALICYSGMVLGMIWTYFLSAYALRNLFERILLRFANRFPEIPEHHRVKVAWAVRITPGIPWFLQNYFLGVSKVPFWPYLGVGMAVQAFFTPAFVIGGGALFEGKAVWFIAALLLLAAGTWFMRRQRKSNKESPL
jgi:uncharacterized membrane protein YdjX (TVP38/TMEM64 family)